MRGYLMGILCAAFLVSLLQAVGGDGAGKGMRKLIGGMFLALAVFRPLGAMELPELSLDQIQIQADAAVLDGQTQAEHARREVIISSCEAYILTKADELGLEPEVGITLNDDEIPCAVTIRAQASPSERDDLTGWITGELGLGKEDVKWIDPGRNSE